MDCPITAQYQPTLAAFSAVNQQRILQYLALLATRRYAPATLRAIPRTLTGFVRALPPERHTVVADDLTCTTPHDITAFLTVGQTAGRGPATFNTKLSTLNYSHSTRFSGNALSFSQ